FKVLENELYNLLLNSKDCATCNHQQIVHNFFNALPNIHQQLLEDAQAMFDGDPAANNLSEVIRTYPGFLAISMYRMVHQLWLDEVPLFPRILTEYAH